MSDIEISHDYLVDMTGLSAVLGMSSSSTFWGPASFVLLPSENITIPTPAGAVAYTVQPDDTVADLADRFGVPAAAIEIANPQIRDSNHWIDQAPASPVLLHALTSSAAGSSRRLVHVQAGIVLRDLYMALDRPGTGSSRGRWALPTLGGSAGQTLGGVVEPFR